MINSKYHGNSPILRKAAGDIHAHALRLAINNDNEFRMPRGNVFRVFGDNFCRGNAAKMNLAMLATIEPHSYVCGMRGVLIIKHGN